MGLEIYLYNRKAIPCYDNIARRVERLSTVRGEDRVAIRKTFEELSKKWSYQNKRIYIDVLNQEKPLNDILDDPTFIEEVKHIDSKLLCELVNLAEIEYHLDKLNALEKSFQPGY